MHVTTKVCPNFPRCTPAERTFDHSCSCVIRLRSGKQTTTKGKLLLHVGKARCYNAASHDDDDDDGRRVARSVGRLLRTPIPLLPVINELSAARIFLRLPEQTRGGWTGDRSTSFRKQVELGYVVINLLGRANLFRTQPSSRVGSFGGLLKIRTCCGHALHSKRSEGYGRGRLGGWLLS